MSVQNVPNISDGEISILKYWFIEYFLTIIHVRQPIFIQVGKFSKYV